MILWILGVVAVGFEVVGYKVFFLVDFYVHCIYDMYTRWLLEADK